MVKREHKKRKRERVQTSEQVVSKEKREREASYEKRLNHSSTSFMALQGPLLTRLHT